MVYVISNNRDGLCNKSNFLIGQNKKRDRDKRILLYGLIIKSM